MRSENVMLGALGETLGMDWGIARIGSVPGTAGYRSPDQAGRPVSLNGAGVLRDAEHVIAGPAGASGGAGFVSAAGVRVFVDHLGRVWVGRDTWADTGLVGQTWPAVAPDGARLLVALNGAVGSFHTALVEADAATLAAYASARWGLEVRGAEIVPR